MFRSVVLGIALFAVALAPASAQRGGGGRGGGGQGPDAGSMPFPRPAAVNKAEQVAKELKIEAKMKDVEEIFNEAQRQYNAIMNPGAGQVRTQLLNAIANGADTSALAKQTAGLESQFAAVEADALAKVLALADAKQKTKAVKVFDIMNGMFNRGDWKNRPM